MIDLYGIVSIPFLKKSAFTGSFRKMRYRLEKVVVEGEERLKRLSGGGMSAGKKF